MPIMLMIYMTLMVVVLIYSLKKIKKEYHPEIYTYTILSMLCMSLDFYLDTTKAYPDILFFDTEMMGKIGIFLILAYVSNFFLGIIVGSSQKQKTKTQKY